MSRYIVLDDDDATLAGGPAAPTADSYSDWGWTVYRQDEDGRLLEAIGSDGGEPEDQLLIRDWKWVAPALEAAYQEGLLEGQAQRDELARRLAHTIGLLSPQLKELVDRKNAAPEDYSESDLLWRRMVMGAAPKDETVEAPIVPCCATCGTGRYIDVTMTCAIDASHKVFDTRTSLPIPARKP